jgi:endonuclease/exonuclease/phosphatase (EEP) superfamily protein YafD
MWWWLVRPQAVNERNPTGLWVVVTVLIFGLLVVFDNFTYDYAFVRELGPELQFLNNVVPTILRGFRGMGLAVLLLAVFLAGVPMVQTRRRVPWAGGRAFETVFGLLVVAGFGVAVAYAARSPIVAAVRDVDQIRVGTYNNHGGFSEFFNFDLEGMAVTIDQSGANVVMLQEIESGRLTSYGVDQPLWLARRLGMDRRFFPTNEGLQGLAVLSNVEIVFDDGNLLPSTTFQTGIQRVQILVDPGEAVITLYNTWLAYAVATAPEAPLDDSEQLAQLNAILSIVASHHLDGILGRTVIGGALNNVPDSPLIERMRQTGFTDPFAGQPIELSATLRRTDRRARFDYLWVRNLTPIGALVMDGAASDHRLVITEVLVARRTEP